MSHGDRDIRETLSGFYQELHQRWKQAEELLLSYRVPAAVSVRIKTVQPAAEEKPFLSACHHDLGFVKHYGRWGICYGLSSDGTPGSLYWMSIQHCSAEQQVEAAACFPDLLQEVTRAAKKYSRTVQEAMSILEVALPGWPQTAAGQPDAVPGPAAPAELPRSQAAAEPVASIEPPEPVPPTDWAVEEPEIRPSVESKLNPDAAMEPAQPAAGVEQPETVKAEPLQETGPESTGEWKGAA